MANLFLYDCNPGSPLHWTYKVFIRKTEFATGAPLPKPNLYASMLLNPSDNRDHLPEDYIADILDTLPEKQRARFRDGLWVKAEGVIYEKFEEAMILEDDELPAAFERYAAGQDFGLNITNVKIGFVGKRIYALADFGAYNMTTRTFDEELAARDWYCDSFTTYCDPAGGERIQEITGGVKANNAVESGIDYLCAKIERNEFFVSRRCSGVLSEIWDYCRDEDGEIVKVNDHFMDALRYAAFSAAQDGVVLV